MDLKIFTQNIEETAKKQIDTLLSIPVFSECKVRIMPDVHAGAGCVIGFTANLGERVIPNIVGVDIGCGVKVVALEGFTEEMIPLIQKIIEKYIPSGMTVRKGDDSFLTGETQFFNNSITYKQSKDYIKSLKCYRYLKDVKYLYASLGTLGGGNHFIEIDKGRYGYFLVIHTGSRNLGKQVAEYYQQLAIKHHSGWDELWKKQDEIIKEYKAQGRRSEIQEAIKELHRQFRQKNPGVPRDLCWLEGSLKDDYLYDMKLCQQWAVLNREMIFRAICYGLNKDYNIKIYQHDSFESVHNYIDNNNMVRKGAIAAPYGRNVIIPLNMRDGSILGVGKGNENWNYSAPHGAGRIMSRSQAFKTLKLDDYKKSMQGVETWSVSENTIDESPMVYKPEDDIVRAIGDTVDIIEIIRPIYNFKAAEGQAPWKKDKKQEECI